MSEQTQNREVKTLPPISDTENPIIDDATQNRLLSQPPQEVFDQRDGNPEVIDVNVVLLTNYLRRHHMVACQEIQKRVRKLTVLLSVPMEPDRDWEADWGGLDVVVQKNRMFTAKWKHSTGFSEQNYIHFPTDTTTQLKRLKPDVIISYEMGVRTLLCGLYRMLRSKCRLIMVGNMSEHVESERGLGRRIFRNIIKRGCDYFTYNGPSCRRYLKSLNISDDKLHHFPYCIDEETVYRGPRNTPHSSLRKMVYCGTLSSRKGILNFAQAAKKWCEANPSQTIELSIAGTGELQQQISDLSGQNFQVVFLGNCDLAGLRSAYQNADLCVFPSLADEWGLVPIEAMASGLPVLGSFYAQSVEAYVIEGKTGWVFRPDENSLIEAAIDRCMQVNPDELIQMGDAAKAAVAGISPASSANDICQLISDIVSK